MSIHVYAENDLSEMLDSFSSYARRGYTALSKFPSALAKYLAYYLGYKDYDSAALLKKFKKDDLQGGVILEGEMSPQEKNYQNYLGNALVKKSEESYIDYLKRLSDEFPLFFIPEGILSEQEAKQVALNQVADELIHSRLSPNIIARVQNGYAADQEALAIINNALRAKYYEEYKHQIYGLDYQESLKNIKSFESKVSGQDSILRYQALQELLENTKRLKNDINKIFYKNLITRHFVSKDNEEKRNDASKNVAMMLMSRRVSESEIAWLQNKFALDKDIFDFLNDVLRRKYFLEYWQKISPFKDQARSQKIKKLMESVENQHSSEKGQLLQKIESNKKFIPNVDEPFDGLNWGKGGLRYQALQELLGQENVLIDQMKQPSSSGYSGVE